MSVPTAYLGIILIWSTTPLAIKWSGDTVGFLFGVTGRMVIGLLLCLVLMGLLRQSLPRHRNAKRAYAAVGITIYGAMLPVYWGVQFIPSGLVSVLFGLAPLLTGLFARLWLQEPFGTRHLAGTAIALIGLAVIFLPATMPAWSLYGITAVLFAVILHSAMSVYLKRVTADLSAFAVTTGGLLVATPLYVLTWLLSPVPHWPHDAPQQALLAILYLGIFGSVLGFILYYYVLRHYPASRTALILLITPVFALILGKVLNDETISPTLWYGSGFILAGLACYQWGEHRAKPCRTT